MIQGDKMLQTSFLNLFLEERK